jgi:DNA-binding GntR family transcriptional regulator
VEHGPNLVWFLDRKAGLMVLMTLMLSADDDGGLPPRGPMSVPVAQLARRFAVSRAQIKDILQGAVAAGLLTAAGPDQSVFVITPRLRESILGFSAALLVLVAESVAAAEIALQENDERLEGVA